MQLYSKLKQYYKYQRNWSKLQSRQDSANEKKHFADEKKFYSQFINNGDLCFDIGANIGDKTELFIQLGAAVVAIEPQESCWRILKRRFRNNKVFIEPVALDSKKGTRIIFIDRSHTLATISQDWINTVKQSGRFSSHKWIDKTAIQTTTLDDLINKYGKPVFCKIDVEGAEFEVLQGLSQTVGTISIEFVSERLGASINCIDYLSSLGKAEFNYCLGGSMVFALPDWVDINQIKSILTAMDNDLENYGDLYIRFHRE
jgi:FkbM family methyltransferase